MARIILPANFFSQKELFLAIKAKHDNNGDLSPLTAFLARNGIDLEAGAPAATNAAQFEKDRIALSSQRENFTQMRDKLFDPVFGRLRGAVQFLKAFYRGEVTELGNWGLSVIGGDRIAYPPGFNHRRLLLTNFVAKHNSFPAGASPLMSYLNRQQINLADDLAAADEAAEHHASHTQASNASELKKQQRDGLWLPVMKQVRHVANFLKKLHTGTEKELGNWGFTVDDSPRKPKLRTIIVRAASQKQTNGIARDSILTNTGPVPLYVYKGNSTTGAAFVVSPGEKLATGKGFSAITVINQSAATLGKFSVLKRN